MSYYVKKLLGMKQKNSKSINLISQDNKNNLILNVEALDLIRDLTGDIAVCLCVGQYRSGKSFLLSRLAANLGKQEDSHRVFVVDHGQDSFTKGCWMNSDIQKVDLGAEKMVNLIFIDTEGIESSNGKEQWDNKLFIFSLLISSLFIYNTNTTLSADLFKNLSFMTSIANRIKLSEILTPDGSSDEDEDTCCVDAATWRSKKEGPVFLAVVRNFTLKEQYTAKEDIDRFLEISENSNENVSERKKNEIRKSMIDSFRSLECVRLPPPAYNLTMLHNLDNEKFGDLCEEFQESFLGMCGTVRKLTQAKSINGEKFNGFKMAEYMKICVKLINEEKSVCLYDALLNVCELEDRHNEEVFIEISNDFIEKAESLSAEDRIQLISSIIKKMKKKINVKSIQSYVKRLVIEYMKIEIEIVSGTLPVQLCHLTDECQRISKACLTLSADFSRNDLSKALGDLKIQNVKEIESADRKLLVSMWDKDLKNKYSHYEGKAYVNLNIFEADLESLQSQFAKKQFVLAEVQSKNFWTEFEKSIDVSAIRTEIKHHSNKLAVEAEKKKLKDIELRLKKANEAARAETQRKDNLLEVARQEAEKRDRELRAAAVQLEENERKQRQLERAREEAEQRNRDLIMKSQKEEAERKRREQAEAENRRLQSVYMSPPATPSYRPEYSYSSPAPQSSPSAYYSSNGSANGREVHTGSRGGSYYMNSSGNKQYVNKDDVRYN